MSLDLTVLMRERLSKELTISLHELLKRKGLAKESIGSHSYYTSTRENINIDVYINRSPLRDEDRYWRNRYDDGELLGFLPKVTIGLASRGTRSAHLKAYSLAKAIARLVGGIIFDHQMSLAYSSRGIPLNKSERHRGDLRYGTPIGVFVNLVAGLDKTLQKGAANKETRRRKPHGSE